MKKTRRDKIIGQLKAKLAAQPELSEDIPGIACWSCGLIENCPDCAGRRRRIDEFAVVPPRGPSEIRETVRRSWDRFRPSGP